MLEFVLCAQADVPRQDNVLFTHVSRTCVALQFNVCSLLVSSPPKKVDDKLEMASRPLVLAMAKLEDRLDPLM